MTLSSKIYNWNGTPRSKIFTAILESNGKGATKAELIAKSGVSNIRPHIKELEDAGLIKISKTRDGSIAYNRYFLKTLENQTNNNSIQYINLTEKEFEVLEKIIGNPGIYFASLRQKLKIKPNTGKFLTNKLKDKKLITKINAQRPVELYPTIKVLTSSYINEKIC